MSGVVYLFLAHLGVGITFTLLLVSKEAGSKFFRFNAGLAAGLIAAALAFRPDVDAPGGAVVTTNAVVALGVALAALTVYWIIAGRVLGWLRPWLATVATLAGAAAAVFHGLAAPSSAGGPLTVLAALTSAALLGGTCTAMVLGHWYLVIPSMQIKHLQRAVGFHIITLVLRIAVVAAVLVVSMSGPLSSGSSVGRYITSLDGIFFWQRVLFGLAGPALLGYMTWETAKIQSTQSATGILYVDLFTVVVGEVLASYVLLSAGLAI